MGRPARVCADPNFDHLSPPLASFSCLHSFLCGRAMISLSPHRPQTTPAPSTQPKPRTVYDHVERRDYNSKPVRHMPFKE